MFFSDKATQIEKCAKKKNSEKLVELLQDKKPEIRIQAIRALGVVGDDRSVNALVALFSSQDPVIRLEAVKSVGVIGNQVVKSHLQHLVKEETNADVIKAIHASLSGIPNKN